MHIGFSMFALKNERLQASHSVLQDSQSKVGGHWVGFITPPPVSG